jgi:hypothetical protein
MSSYANLGIILSWLCIMICLRSDIYFRFKELDTIFGLNIFFGHYLKYYMYKNKAS